LPSEGSPSWDSRENAGVCCDVLKQTLDIIKGRLTDPESFVSVAAGHVVQKYFIHNVHCYPKVATALGLPFLYPPQQRESVLEMSNISSLAPKGSMLTHYIHV
jgi:hypothetical protein